MTDPWMNERKTEALESLAEEARTTNRLMVALIDQLTGIAVGLRDAEQLRIRPYLTGDEWKRLEVPDEHT